MSNNGNRKRGIDNPQTVPIIQQSSNSEECATYTFPDIVRNSETPGHFRSVSHGGGSVLSTGTVTVGRSALKGARGHQRALSQGQIVDATVVRPGHSRVGSKTDFILPPGHKEADKATGAVSRGSIKGHSRQASRTESIYTLRRAEPPSLFRRLLCSLMLRSPKKDPDERYYSVVPNHIVPPKTSRKEHPNGRRPNNKIRTTKYTLLSFLPRNLLEQFHRVANLYFIFIVLLNWLPPINAFGKEVAMIPVMFVLGVTAVKDLFEDRRRHTSDKRINNSTCRIYNSETTRYQKVLWKEVRVGDLIHLSNNEIVPADILLLRSSDPAGICYIDTGHLDGETNLKQRQVARGFVDKQQIFEPSKFRSTIEVEAPTTKIYRFHGAIVHSSGSRVPVGTDNFILRECLLKNTDYVEGIVVYTGHETKAMLNNGGPRYKRSSLEIQMNQDVIWCVFILIFLCVVGAIGCKLWLNTYPNLTSPFIENDPTTETILAFWTFVIILQIMIPLSLYVTLEMCKIIQVYHIHHNVDLYDPVTDKRTECRALNITEQLGQIQYIFSDKTGTLTENRMIFRRCAVAGTDYHHSLVEADSSEGSLDVLVNEQLARDLRRECAIAEQVHSCRSAEGARIQEFLVLLAVCNTVVCARRPHHDLMNASGIVEDPPKTNRSEQSSTSQSMTSEDASAGYGRRNVAALTPIDSVESSTSEYFHQAAQRPKLLDVASSLYEKDSNLTDEQKASLNRDVSTTPSPYELRPVFEAESPDELALVDAAYIYGCRLVKRTPTAVTVETPELVKMTYEILNVLPFDSARKRMSVIVRHPYTKQIILYSKGADSAILPHLTPVEDDSEQKVFITKTDQHLNSYAREGLRVLVMAKRVLAPHQYEEWLKKHREAELSGHNSEKRLQESYSSIECNFTLLGATGIEDRLQEGVPETISSLISAGIRFWVLTGDKPETAINVAYSARLFSPRMELMKIMARSKEAAEATIYFYLSQIERSGAGEGPETDFRPTNAIIDRYSLSFQMSSERALAVDGKTLTFILDRRTNLIKPFLKLTTYCSSVLCCRATPLQKAYIVRLVKEELKMNTLAIGDGANDVSMIQTADVGIGISGQEGMQAVMAADFAITRFKYLKAMLLVHGHWSYDRLSRMVLYFFYKNAAFVFLCFWFQFYCGFSGTVMIDQMYLMLYNLLFTSLPPVAIGVYDKDAPYDILLDKPYLYGRGRENQVYKPYAFWLTMLDALYQSVCIFWVCQIAYSDTDVDVFEFGTVSTTACMFVMLFHASIEIRSWTVIQVASIVLSVGAFYLYSLLYNTYCVNCFGLPSTYWTIQMAMARPIYWLVTLLSCVLALLPRILYRVTQTLLVADDVTKVILNQRRVEKQETNVRGLRITI